MALTDMTEILVPHPVPRIKRGYKEIKSPDAKKEKREHIQKMETFNDWGKDPVFVNNSIVICKLIRESSYAGVKTLINCYNPMIETDIETIKKHMLECTRLGGEKTDVFKLAIKYVTNDKTEIDETDLGELAEILIAAIKNKTSTYCEDCNK